MSNRVVSTTYRTVIDDVISNVRQDFEDMGIEKEVLEELQRSWEAKIVATGVADFEGAPVVPPRSRRAQTNGTASTSASTPVSETVIKSEDGTITPVSNKVARTNGASDVRSGIASSSGGDAIKSENGISNGSSSASGSMAIEGLLSSNDATSSSSSSKRKRPEGNENEIGSDLDDSDEEELEGAIDAEGNEDMILCLYDKVQRVRNKWKCVLKDGIASIDGRDYVFSKLAAELEW